MKYAAFLLVLCVSSFLLAQSPAVPSQSKAVVIVPAATSCPVTMQARQLAGNGVMRAKDGKTPDAPQTRLHVTLTPPDGGSTAIVSATVEVHGLNGKPGVFPLIASRESAAETSRILILNLAHGESHEFWSDLVLAGLTGPKRIDLKSVTYADGSVWKAPKGNLCQVVPDPYMLIAVE